MYIEIKKETPFYNKSIQGASMPQAYADDG